MWNLDFDNLATGNSLLLLNGFTSYQNRIRGVSASGWLKHMKGRAALSGTKANCSFCNYSFIAITLKRKWQGLVIIYICVCVHAYKKKYMYVCVYTYVYKVNLYTFWKDPVCKQHPTLLSQRRFYWREIARKALSSFRSASTIWESLLSWAPAIKDCIAIISNSCRGGGSVGSRKQRGRFL